MQRASGVARILIRVDDGGYDDNADRYDAGDYYTDGSSSNTMGRQVFLPASIPSQPAWTSSYISGRFLPSTFRYRS